MERWLKFVLILLFPILANGQPPVRWENKSIQLPSDVRIESVASSNKDTLILSEAQRVQIDKFPTNSEDYTSYRNLSDENKTSIQRIRRDVVLALAKLSLKGKLNSLSIVQGNKAVHVEPNQKSLDDADLTLVDPIDNALGLDSTNLVTYRSKNSKLKSFLKMLNEAVLLSTFKSIKHHSESRTYMKKHSNEVGISIVFKAEFQFGIGDFNITKNLPININIGYKRDTREVIVSVGQRVERMNAGTAFSAGVKLELKKYSSINSPEDTIADVGTAWYPPSIPVLSMVGDSSPRTHATGVVFGLNVADLVPGLYFLNTVNAYSDRKLYVKHIKLPDVKGWFGKMMNSLRSIGTSSPEAALVCNGYLR